MRPEAQLIVKLLGGLIESTTPHVINNTTKGSLPKEVRQRIASFPLMLRFADDDMKAMIALAEIIFEKRVRPLLGKDEQELTYHYGVEVFNDDANENAVQQMNRNLKDLELIREQSEAMKTLGQLIVGKAVALGPTNASQIGLDKSGYDRLVRACDKNINGVDRVLGRHTALKPILMQLVD